MIAEPDPLDRRRPQTELALQLVDLGAPGDVDGLALREVELETVVRAPRDRDVQRRAGLRILERQEDVRPGVVAPELRDLALDPDRRQSAEVHPDAAVEGRDREDLAVAVDEVLDLRHAASVSPAADPPTPAREDVLDGGAHGVRDEHEEAVAGLDDRAAAWRDRVVAAYDDGDDRGSRQTDLADGRTRDRVIGRDDEVEKVQRARLADLDRRLVRRAVGDSSSSRPATRSSVVPWRIAETTTTKKTALKIVFAVSTSDESTNVASTIGTAPRRPAHPSRSRSRAVKSLNAVDTHTATGRMTSMSSSARASPERRDVGELAREDEQAEDDEQRHLGEEREALVEADELAAVARRRAADCEPDEVDGEEAAPTDDVGGAERDRRRRERGDRGERADRARKSREHPGRGESQRSPTTSPRPIWRTTSSTSWSNPSVSGLSIQAISPIVSAIAIGSLPPDSASSVRASRRLICVKRSVANTAAASVDATTAPSRNASSQVRSNSARAATPVSRAVTTTPTVLRSAAGTTTARSRRQEVCRASLEEDQDEADDADVARELGVVELDAARARPSRGASRARGTRRAPARPCEPIRGRRARWHRARPRRRAERRLRPPRHPCGSRPQLLR